MNNLWKIYKLSFILSHPIISYTNQIYRALQANYGNVFKPNKAILLKYLWKIYQLSFTLLRPIISYPNQIYRSIQDNYGNLFRQAILLKFVWKIYQLSFTLRILSKTNHGSISMDPPTKIESYPNHWDQIWIHLSVTTNSLTVIKSKDF